jgi:hypothetical protein
MRLDRRTLTYVVIALIVGAALALAVALAQGADNASGTPGKTTAGEVALGGLSSSDTGTAAIAAADPAKEQPPLDKFTSKDPFIPFNAPATATPSPSSTSNPSNELGAKVKVDGTTYNVMQGDQVPGGSAAAFTIAAITASDVTFKLIEGKFMNGDTSITVNLGESVTVEKMDGPSYDLAVLAIGASSTGGGSNGTSTGHSISVLSISSQNGVAVATFEVDGKTYPDKQVGAVFTTSFGQIEVLAIDVDGQTVTILHGDQRLTLHAGQVVIK